MSQALDRLNCFFEKKSENHICIGHLTLAGSLYVGDEIDDLHNELHCPIDMFASKFTATFMGHIHKPQVLSEEPFVGHVGSLDISDFGETNHNKIIYLYDSKKNNKIIKLDVPTRKLKKIEICIPESVDPTQYILDTLNNEEDKDSLHDSILKLELKFEDSKSKIDSLKFNETLKKYSIHNLSGVIESRASTVVSSDKRNSLNSSMSPKDAFKDWLDSKDLTENKKSKIINIAADIIEQVLSK